MKYITNYTIALCIIALAASTTQSLPTESSLPVSIIRSTLISRPIEFAQNFLLAQLNSTLSRENENARTHYNQTADFFEAFEEVIDGIFYTINEKIYTFKATLGTNEIENEKSRMIFWNWVRTGFDLRRKYFTCITDNMKAIANDVAIVLKMNREFDLLKSYKNELENCIAIVDLSRWMIPVAAACTASCGFKILATISVVKFNMSVYEESVKNIQTFLDETRKGENCPNFRSKIPAELRDFHEKSLSF